MDDIWKIIFEKIILDLVIFHKKEKQKKIKGI